MKLRFKRSVALAVALLTLALSLSSCGGGNKIVLDDGKYVDKSTKVVYIDAPACYEPIAMGDELYGKIGSAEIYAIEGADPSKWLCESTGSVFYAEGVELPTLDEMNISYTGIYMEDTELARITDSAVIGSLVSTYVEGEEILKPSYFESSLAINWRIRFADEELGIYYVLNYLELKQDYTITLDDGTEVNYGRAFIFNRFEGKCVVAGDVLKAYVDEYNALNEAK